MTPNTMSQILEFSFALVVFVVTMGFGIIILVKMARGDINLSRLISEPNGDASLSRFQFLIFTFVVALGLFLIIVSKTPPDFPNPIPAEILTLVGISASSYLVSKGIQFSSDAGVKRPGLTLTPTQADFTNSTNPAVQQFTASIPNAPAGTPLPAITWSLDSPALGTIDSSGLYAPPKDPPPTPTKITIRAKASGYEDGLAVVTVGPPLPQGTRQG